MVYLFMRICIQLLSFIPLPIARYMGKTLGRSVNLINIKRSRISLNNLRHSCLNKDGGSGIKRLNDKVFEHFGQMFFELPHILRINKGNLHEYVTFQGEENMCRALQSRKGVFVLTAHLGNWEMLAAAIPIRFGPSAVVARPSHYPPFNRLMTNLRSRFGMEIIPKLNGMRKILSALNQNKIIGILLDQNVDWYQGVFAEFMGRKACVNKALAHMALKFDTPVVPVFCIRQKKGMYKIVIKEAVKLVRTGSKIEDIKINTALFTKIIEKQVLETPDQWFWFHRRWKTRPFCPISFEEKKAILEKQDIRILTRKPREIIPSVVHT